MQARIYIRAHSVDGREREKLLCSRVELPLVRTTVVTARRTRGGFSLAGETRFPRASKLKIQITDAWELGRFQNRFMQDEHLAVHNRGSDFIFSPMSIFLR